MSSIWVHLKLCHGHAAPVFHREPTQSLERTPSRRLVPNALALGAPAPREIECKTGDAGVDLGMDTSGAVRDLTVRRDGNC